MSSDLGGASTYEKVETSLHYHSIVCIDHFSKGTQANPIKNKDALAVTQVLNELICRHGCFEIQLNEQGREFVSLVSTELLALIGVEQQITSTYHT